MNKSLFATLILLVAATAGYGFWTIGSPSAERARRIDQQRLSDLWQIANGADMYWAQNGKLPSSLDELRRTRDISVAGIADPETRTPYEFASKGVDVYELCANFSAPSQPNDLRAFQPYPYPSTDRGPSFWTHAAGRSCFTITVIKPPGIKP